MLSQLDSVIWTEAFELKCPYRQDVHYQYVSDGVLPAVYKPQVYWHMLCTGTSVARFVSFDPRADDDIRLFECVERLHQPYMDDLTEKLDRVLEVLEAGETFSVPSNSNLREIFK